MTKTQPKYDRVLLKLSGEAMSGDGNLDFSAITAVAKAIKTVCDLGVRLAIVIGAGNILRGAPLAKQIKRVTADKMGMLGTTINALALHGCLEKMSVKAKVLSAVNMTQICESYTDCAVAECLEQGQVILFSGGTGHPFFTTDTAASLRATQIGADLMIKATKVDGVYDGNPITNKTAKLYETITYDKVLEGRLDVMDAAAVILCRDNHIPIRVCNMTEPDALQRVICGEALGTLIG